jgi:hypothetical protein
MKNNLFLISESEKSRILNMHKKATNSLYLSEQAAQPAAAQPAQVPTDLKSVADIQNFLIGKGFDVGKTGADGKMGPATIAALGKFMSGGGGTTPTPGTPAAGGTTATAGTPAAGGTTATAGTPAAGGTTPPAATQAAQAVTTAAQQTTNVPLASRKDIRQGNRQVRQDQRTLNRLGGRMTPEQQKAYQQSIASRTGISK